MWHMGESAHLGRVHLAHRVLPGHELDLRCGARVGSGWGQGEGRVRVGPGWGRGGVRAIAYLSNVLPSSFPSNCTL